MTHGDIHNAAGGTALVAFLDVLDVAKENGADLVAIEVLGKAIDVSARGGADEPDELTGHRGLEAADVGNTIADLGDHRSLLVIDHGVDVVQVRAEILENLLRADVVIGCHLLLTSHDVSSRE